MLLVVGLERTVGRQCILASALLRHSARGDDLVETVGKQSEVSQLCRYRRHFTPCPGLPRAGSGVGGLV